MLRVGFDVGGTFTDIVVADERGVRGTFKILTSPHDPIQPMVEGLVWILNEIGAKPRDVEQAVHGTTLVTNAIIEGKGAPTALITTKGFRDVAEIGREWRYDMYDIFLEPPPVLVPRCRRLEVEERTTAAGRIVAAVRPEELASLIDTLPAEITSVAICFLHSYANPQNERSTAALVSEMRPDLHVSVSVDVAPEIREFERLSTTIANAYVKPLVEPYLNAFQRRLRSAGVHAQLLIVLSNGGLVMADDASRFPVRIVESGPAAGVMGAAYLSRCIGRERVLAFDMGGTTAKVSFIDHGQPLVTREFEAARAYRHKAGSGIPLKVPAIKLLEVGAGGGSIAHVDGMGRLRVGPASAGSAPGPMCYGLGGTKPTVTDADLLLGYLDAEFFLGGRMSLDRAAAARGVDAEVAAPLGLDTTRAAWGIHKIINENMANALRVHSAEGGKDPRSYSMVTFGGAGGVHACRVADALHISTVIFPPLASVLSAFGMLTAPLAFDFVRTSRNSLAGMDWNLVNLLFGEMESDGRRLLESSGIKPDEIQIERVCEMRFAGQGYEVEVPIPNGLLGPEHEAEIRRRFGDLYKGLYGSVPNDVTLEGLNWRVRVFGRTSAIDPAPKLTVARRIPRPRRRTCYFPETGFADMPIFARNDLTSGNEIIGPCIVQQDDTTIVVPPAWNGEMDSFGNLVLRKGS